MKMVGIFVVLGCLLSPLGAFPPPEDYRKAWMLEHWNVDQSLPSDSGDRNDRQFGGLGDLGKVADSIGKFDLREVSKFLKEIPELFESVNTIVDGAETSFGEGGSDS